MAQRWGLDPDVVANWSMPHYSDRQEFLWVQDEMKREPKEEKKEVWQGPNNDG